MTIIGVGEWISTSLLCEHHCWGRWINPCFTTVWAKWIVDNTFCLLFFLPSPLRIVRLWQKVKGSVATLTLYSYDYSARREVVKKAVAFIWNYNNTKERPPTYLLVECLHPKLLFDEVWSLLDCSTVDGYYPLYIKGLRIFDPKIWAGASRVNHDQDLFLWKVRRVVLALVKNL